jgi:hypothetical protein
MGAYLACADAYRGTCSDRLCSPRPWTGELLTGGSPVPAGGRPILFHAHHQARGAEPAMITPVRPGRLEVSPARAFAVDRL